MMAFTSKAREKLNQQSCNHQSEYYFEFVKSLKRDVFSDTRKSENVRRSRYAEAAGMIRALSLAQALLATIPSLGQMLRIQ